MTAPRHSKLRHCMSNHCELIAMWAAMCSADCACCYYDWGQPSMELPSISHLLVPAFLKPLANCDCADGSGPNASPHLPRAPCLLFQLISDPAMQTLPPCCRSPMHTRILQGSVQRRWRRIITYGWQQ
jgi:hypothetical protein